MRRKNKMYKKGLVITNAFARFKETLVMVNRLVSEFAAFHIVIEHLTNDKVLAFIDEEGNAKTNLVGYDFIIYMDKDYYIASLLEKCGFKLFNSAEGVRICDDKMLTHLVLSNHQIKMPLTINYPLSYTSGDSTVFLAKIEEKLKYPLIVKNYFGSLGEQVHLINSFDQLREVSKSLHYTPHIYQQYIASSFGKDLRIVLVNKKIVAAMKRVAQNEGEFRSNIETGGLGFVTEIPESFARMAVKVATVLNLDYCGLDILYGDNYEPILLEVNANAFFSPIEKFSKVNVARPYVEYIVKTIYQ